MDGLSRPKCNAEADVKSNTHSPTDANIDVDINFNTNVYSAADACINDTAIVNATAKNNYTNAIANDARESFGYRHDHWLWLDASARGNNIDG